MSASGESVRVLYVGSGGERDESVPDRLERVADDVDVETATGVEAARDALADATVDCVVARENLPDGSGVSFLGRVCEAHPDLPVVLAPVDGSEALASEAVSAGVTEYMQNRPGVDRSGDLAALVSEAADRQSATAESRGEGQPTEESRPIVDPAGEGSPSINPKLDMDLSAQLNLLEQIFRQVPVSLYVKDTEGRHLLMSDFEEDPVEAVGMTDLEIYTEEMARETYEDDMQVIESGEPIYNKEEYNPESGEWVLTSKVPWYDADGEVMGLIGVSRFITEKKEYEREIERENERLERFAGVISHDLRNPLNVAQGRLELLADEIDDYGEDVDGEYAGVDDEHDHIEAIADALDRMETLIDDVLDLARQGQTIDETEPVVLSEAVEQAWRTVETGDATLRVASDCRLAADPTRLVDLLANVVRNSVEHGSETVTVRAGATDGGFYVEDDGPGIPDGDKDEALEAGFTTNTDGTGFGLAIVSEIADAHGWEVTVADAHGGEEDTGADELPGARFEFDGVEVHETDIDGHETGADGGE